MNTLTFHDPLWPYKHIIWKKPSLRDLHTHDHQRQECLHFVFRKMGHNLFKMMCSSNLARTL